MFAERSRVLLAIVIFFVLFLFDLGNIFLLRVAIENNADISKFPAGGVRISLTIDFRLGVTKIASLP